MNRYVPAVTGIAGIVVVVVGADVWAARTHRPTISATVAGLLDHQVGGPVVIGVLTGLGWHLVGDPVIRSLARGIERESAR